MARRRVAFPRFWQGKAKYEVLLALAEWIQNRPAQKTTPILYIFSP